ncbi:MAG TPA: hypothetical protein VFJ58_00510 [Armatimonadota bacterium]|nr:hypothetical protein [Armatimonadota bacterium]
MTSILDSHRYAMELVDEALRARAIGQPERAREFFEKAMAEEAAAASLVPPTGESEPTRSVLYRSAATLAMDCGQLREAERLAAAGLSGYPPPEIAEELRVVIDRASFARHLETKGIVLAERDMQFTMAGPGIGHGFARSEEFVDRVRHTSGLLRRTAERLLGRVFQERGPASSSVSRETELYLSTPRAASFAVTYRVGRPSAQMALNLDNPQPDVIPEFLACFQLASEGRERELQQRIDQPAYYRNFIALLRQIAPDGREVKLVGFTSQHAGTGTRVQLVRTPQDLPLPPPADNINPRAERVQITGLLQRADATQPTSERITLVDSRNAKHIIIVPEGIGEIVRSLWNETVTVTGVKDGKIIEMMDIQRVVTQAGIDLGLE